MSQRKESLAQNYHKPLRIRSAFDLYQSITNGDPRTDQSRVRRLIRDNRSISGEKRTAKLVLNAGVERGKKKLSYL